MMTEPNVPNQAVIDGLSAGVLAGTVDMYAAKRAIEHDDRPAAIELLAKSGLGALVMEHCWNCDDRRVFLRTQFGSSYRWTCERCGVDLVGDCPICGKTDGPGGHTCLAEE
jgi:rubrerythrin